MAVTDLTGTKWRFNDDVPFTTSGYFAIDFQSAGNSYTSFNYTFMSRPDFARWIDYVDSESNITRVYDFSWVDEDYRIINITGGEEVENPDLITWLESYATQIQDESNPISIGNLPIANMYFGTRQVKKVYLGNTLVWEKATEEIPENALLVQDGALLTSDGGYLITTVQTN